MQHNSIEQIFLDKVSTETMQKMKGQLLSFNFMNNLLSDELKYSLKDANPSNKLRIMGDISPVSKINSYYQSENCDKTVTGRPGMAGLGCLGGCPRSQLISSALGLR